MQKNTSCWSVEDCTYMYMSTPNLNFFASPMLDGVLLSTLSLCGCGVQKTKLALSTTPKRAVVTDVDGTLFSFAGRDLSPGNRKALQALGPPLTPIPPCATTGT